MTLQNGMRLLNQFLMQICLFLVYFMKKYVFYCLKSYFKLIKIISTQNNILLIQNIIFSQIGRSETELGIFQGKENLRISTF